MTYVEFRRSTRIARCTATCEAPAKATSRFTRCRLRLMTSRRMARRGRGMGRLDAEARMAIKALSARGSRRARSRGFWA